MEQIFIYLIKTFGYLGVFLVSLISSSSILLPLPGFMIIFSLGTSFNPLALGLMSGLGSTIGEMTGFLLGFGSKKIISKKYRKELQKIENLFQKYHGELVIFAFAVLPLPFDLVGIFCGNIGYPTKTFFIATLAGKLVKYTAIAYMGFYGITWVKDYLVQ